MGETTWQELYAEWVNTQKRCRRHRLPWHRSAHRYCGNAVRLVQVWLETGLQKLIPAFPRDGGQAASGSGTASAVRAFQRLFGLTADGVVGAGTWAKLNEVGLAVANNLVGKNIQPGQLCDNPAGGQHRHPGAGAAI